MTDPRYPAGPQQSGYPPAGNPPPPGYPPSGGPAGGWTPQPPAGGGAGGHGGWQAPPGGPGGQGGWQAPPGGGGGGGGRSALLVVLGVIIVLALAGGAFVLLSGDDEAASGPPEGVTLADLEPALLTDADVGSAFWLDESSDDSDDDDALGDEIDASEECETAVEALESANAEESEELNVDFTNASDGGLEQTISLGGEGEPTLAEARTAIEQCDTMTYSEGGAEAEITISTSDVGGVGDNAMGVTMNLELTSAGVNVSIQTYGVMWERDGVHVTMSGTGGFDESTQSALPIDHAVVEHLARTADQRLIDVLPG